MLNIQDTIPKSAFSLTSKVFSILKMGGGDEF